MARPSWDAEMREAAMTTLDSLHWVKGPQGASFGREFADYCGAVQGTPCQSGSVALWGALRLLDIGPGDEVLVPSLTYIATATCVSLVGATPVFVDVEPDHWCVDIASLEAARSPRTKAVIAVHLFGQMCDDALVTWCKEHDITYIEDAAQAHGAVAANGTKAGGVGDVACFSFFPSKNLAVGGEGGMMMTKRDDLAARMDALVNHGRDARLESHELGSNLRMSEVTASIGRVQLRRLEAWLARRRAIAQQYNDAFSQLPGLILQPFDRTPCTHGTSIASWWMILRRCATDSMPPASIQGFTMPPRAIDNKSMPLIHNTTSRCLLPTILRTAWWPYPFITK